MRAPSDTAALEWNAKGSCVSPEGRILEMVARGMSLSHVLDGLCRLVEEQAPGVLASVLAELAHVTGLTTLGQLAPSTAREVNQPLPAIAQAISHSRQLEQLRRADEPTPSEAEPHGDVGLSEIVGHSEAMRRVLKAVATVAPTDSTVLIGGETGTGKELIARAIHDRSRRRSRPFVTLNCAAIPSGLLESELFGHEKGAFTGALARRVGRFELANGGTLFLDEIGDIPLDLQPKLLRVLQEQAFERLGSTQTIRVGVRLIAATNLDLATMVADKRFRSDLYYRLNVFPIAIPPLRDRREDIPALVDHFIRMYAGRLNRRVEPVSPSALKALTDYDWPGNVRELANVVERVSITAHDGDLRFDLLLGGDRSESAGRGAVSVASSPGEILSEAAMRQQERENIAAALRRTRGKIYGEDGAARLLGIKPTTLLSRLVKLGLKPTRQVPLVSAQAAS
jgi:formate hydrogenlyase transcriptional activator